MAISPSIPTRVRQASYGYFTFHPHEFGATEPALRKGKSSCVFVVGCTAAFHQPSPNDPPTQIDKRRPELTSAFGIALADCMIDVFRRTELRRETFDEGLSK